MKAIIVKEFGSAPSFGSFDEPVAAGDEVKVEVSATTLAPLVKLIAKGEHYAGGRDLPFVPGIDGVGRLPDGRRVYFMFPRAPFGSMAEMSVVKTRWTVEVPAELGDEAAAALPNSGLSSWIALKVRARFERGETALVHGATGSAGGLAVQVAKHLGAGRIIATGRGADRTEALKALGADVVVDTDGAEPEVRERYAGAGVSEVDIVLDYLGGAPAESLLRALTTGAGSPFGERRLRYVQIGSAAGPSFRIDGAALRSSGVEIVGSGVGAFSLDQSIACVGELLRAAIPAKLSLRTRSATLADVESAWAYEGAEKIVFRP